MQRSSLWECGHEHKTMKLKPCIENGGEVTVKLVSLPVTTWYYISGVTYSNIGGDLHIAY